VSVIENGTKHKFGCCLAIMPNIMMIPEMPNGPIIRLEIALTSTVYDISSWDVANRRAGGSRPQLAAIERFNR
jgi:hypothetical protein